MSRAKDAAFLRDVPKKQQRGFETIDWIGLVPFQDKLLKMWAAREDRTDPHTIWLVERILRTKQRTSYRILAALIDLYVYHQTYDAIGAVRGLPREGLPARLEAALEDMRVSFYRAYTPSGRGSLDEYQAVPHTGKRAGRSR